MPIPWAAIAAGGASLLGGAMGNRAQRKESARNRRFQERMRNTAWQATVADMTAAGINPALAYSQGPAASPGGSMASQDDVISPGVSSAMQATRMKKDIQLLSEQISKTREERRATKIQGDTALARLQSYGVDYSPTGRLLLKLPDKTGLPRMTQEIEAGIQLTRERARREGYTADTLSPLSDLARQLGILLPIIGGVGKLSPGVLKGIGNLRKIRR